ncbi:hypothetical protein M758_5G054400 [Ceratodon purpureus]|nr:hypothetical protein M758_5G054400 [Ceratodon purpureus]
MHDATKCTVILQFRFRSSAALSSFQGTPYQSSLGNYKRSEVMHPTACSCKYCPTGFRKGPSKQIQSLRLLSRHPDYLTHDLILLINPGMNKVIRAEPQSRSGDQDCSDCSRCKTYTF